MLESEWHGLRRRLHLHLLRGLLCLLWRHRELRSCTRLLHLLLRLVSTHRLCLRLELGRLPSHDLLGRLWLLLRLLHLLLVLLDVHSLAEGGLHWVLLCCSSELGLCRVLWLLLLWLWLRLLSWCLLNRLHGLLLCKLRLLLDDRLHSRLGLRLLHDLLLNHLWLWCSLNTNALLLWLLLDDWLYDGLLGPAVLHGVRLLGSWLSHHLRLNGLCHWVLGCLPGNSRCLLLAHLS